MAHEDVGQLQALSRLTQAQLAAYPARTLLYLGIAGGNGLEYLKHTEKTVWDFTANTNAYVMEQVLRYFGPERFIYGSDFPIFRMKARRVVENGFYINEIPAGSLGDVSSDPHMREIPYPEAEKITFFIYEEIAACRKATEALGLGKDEVNKIFYENSARIFGLK